MATSQPNIPPPAGSTDQVEQEVVQHRGHAVDDHRVTEDGLDLLRQHLETLDRLDAHDVVEAREHAQVMELILRLLALGRAQVLPVASLLLILFLFDLGHVLQGNTTTTGVIGLYRDV